MDHQDTLDILATLLETCSDGERGFRTAAEHVRSAALKTLLAARAGECRQAGAELRAHVLQLGGEVGTEASMSAARHRGWIARLGAPSGYSDRALLEACERGEDSALERYRDALDAPLPDATRRLIERQHENIQRHHALVRALRERASAIAG